MLKPKRTPISIHPEVRASLAAALCEPPFEGSGIGFSAVVKTASRVMREESKLGQAFRDALAVEHTAITMMDERDKRRSLESQINERRVHDKLDARGTTTRWMLVADTDGVRANDEYLERLVEGVRNWALPTAWGFQGNGPRKPQTIRIEFEIESNERSTGAYLEDLRNELLYFALGPGQYEIQEVE